MRREPRSNYRPISWPDFCVWLTGRRVVDETEDGGATTLDFADGTQAILTSGYSEPTAGYSEVTPGDDGYVTPPTVMVYEDPNIHDEDP
jgi:hypothetical protein